MDTTRRRPTAELACQSAFFVRDTTPLPGSDTGPDTFAIRSGDPTKPSLPSLKNSVASRSADPAKESFPILEVNHALGHADLNFASGGVGLGPGVRGRLHV
jgi:hypothetical protein